MKKIILSIAIVITGLAGLTAEADNAYLTPVLFIGAYVSAYEIPHQVEAEPWVSWAAVSGVVVVDYFISRERFPEEMTGDNVWNDSSQMSAVLLTSTVGAGVISTFLPEQVTDKRLDFAVHFLTGMVSYTVWHAIDTGRGPWE